MGEAEWDGFAVVVGRKSAGLEHGSVVHGGGEEEEEDGQQSERRESVEGGRVLAEENKGPGARTIIPLPSLSFLFKLAR